MIPLAQLKAKQLKEYLLEVVTMVKHSVGRAVSIICDNCQLNQQVYKHLGGPGLIQVPNENDTLQMYLVYDYVHMFFKYR